MLVVLPIVSGFSFDSMDIDQMPVVKFWTPTCLNLEVGSGRSTEMSCAPPWDARSDWPRVGRFFFQRLALVQPRIRGFNWFMIAYIGSIWFNLVHFASTTVQDVSVVFYMSFAIKPF